MTDIVSYTGPGFYPPILVDALNAAWTLGTEKQALFETKIANATSGWLDSASAPEITASVVGVPTVVEPSVAIPASASVAEVMATFDTKTTELVNLFAGKVSDFIAMHFAGAGANNAAVEAWLADALANPDQVLPPALADIIWEQDRTRVLADAVRASEEVVAFWAAKGHPLSTGRELDAVVQIQRGSHSELATSSRNVATKTFELAYDRVKFVISAASSAQQSAMSAAFEYVKTLAVGPDVSSRLVDAGYSAETKLIAAAGAFYGARSEAAKVSLSAAQFNAGATQGAEEKNQASELSVMQLRLQAMLEEAKALAQMATSLFNNSNLGVSISAGDSVSTSL